MKRLKGFTLVELVITIAIVIILSVVSIPIYKGYTRNAKMTEGYALLGTILSAQKNFYSQKGSFRYKWNGESVVWTCNDEEFGIDARGNKYFTEFYIGDGHTGTDKAFRFHAGVRIPEELRNSSGSTALILSYDLTVGPNFSERS